MQIFLKVCQSKYFENLLGIDQVISLVFIAHSAGLFCAYTYGVVGPNRLRIKFYSVVFSLISRLRQPRTAFYLKTVSTQAATTQTTKLKQNRTVCDSSCINSGFVAVRKAPSSLRIKIKFGLLENILAVRKVLSKSAKFGKI